MAIKGTGIDIVEISRVSNIIARYGEKFIGKVFTDAEAALCARPSLSRSAAAFAGRFAAKEAFYKALPGDIQALSSWKSIQILSDASGRPRIDICCERLRTALFDECGATSMHLSISHEKNYCVAIVILE
jgi:holo-[acyl-carrier-protein] synthase